MVVTWGDIKMADINYGILDTAPKAPNVQQYSVQPNQNTNALLGGIQAGQQMGANAAQSALAHQELAQREKTNPLDVQAKQQAVAAGALELSQKQRAEQDTLKQRAAAAQGWDSYIQQKQQTDPQGALEALNQKTNMEKNLIGKASDIENLSFAKAEHAKATMVNAGNIMHDVMTNSMNPQTGHPDDAKIVAAYQAQYPQISKIDPTNAPDPKTATPAQIEAYGASSMHMGLDYSLAMKAKYAEMQNQAAEIEKTKTGITTDAIKNATVAAASSIPVKQSAQQYSDLLNEIKPNQVGPGFNLTLKGKQIMAALGGDPNLSVPEALKLASNKLLVSNLKQLKTMPRSAAVIDTIKGANADPNMQLDTQKMALSNILQESNENITKPDFMQDFKNKNENDLAGSNSAWQKFLDADPQYQKTGQHDPQWVSNPDNYKPFLDREYKAPVVAKEAVAKSATTAPSLEDLMAEKARRSKK